GQNTVSLGLCFRLEGNGLGIPLSHGTYRPSFALCLGLRLCRLCLFLPHLSLGLLGQLTHLDLRIDGSDDTGRRLDSIQGQLSRDKTQRLKLSSQEGLDLRARGLLLITI